MGKQHPSTRTARELARLVIEASNRYRMPISLVDKAEVLLGTAERFDVSLTLTQVKALLKVVDQKPWNLTVAEITALRNTIDRLRESAGLL